jgi:nucleoside-diphosphate-sugar epimerase
MKRAVVIGGAGFVGRRLVEMLAGEAAHPGWPTFDAVHVLDVAELRPLSGTRVPVTSERGDIRSRQTLKGALEGAHTVFHTASLVDVGLRPNPAIDAVNVEGTRNVVEVAAALGVPFLIYTSSEDVALSETPVRGADETLSYPSRPIHDYVRTKIEGERIALGADGTNGMRTLSIRPVHVYGPGDPHAIITSLKAFGKGTVPFLLGDGSARFDVVYVDNVVHAHLLGAAKLADPQAAPCVAGRAYIANEDNAPNYFDFLRPYAAAKGVTMPRFHLGRRRTRALAQMMAWTHRLTGLDVPFHPFHSYVICEDFFFSSDRAKNELGYAPLVAPAEGQARTVRWLEGVSLD